MRLYVLNGKTPVQARSFDEWINWLSIHSRDMIVANTQLDDGTFVLTMFLGHSTIFSDESNPQTFSTRVLGGEFNNREKFHTSWESAEKGHEEMVLSLLEDSDPDWPEALEEVQAKVTLC